MREQSERRGASRARSGGEKEREGNSKSTASIEPGSRLVFFRHLTKQYINRDIFPLNCNFRY